jgi:hypothetical protein
MEPKLIVLVSSLLNSVVDPDTGASAFLTTGYGILDGYKISPDPG